ncbi:MAG: hypothetical protein J5588_05645 [Bacteroidales bacterium]|nr:hypothetical protein [Bacteroidales bacterium]MBO7054654.1 hypothetical protein [Bacteroidales bacterium]
MEDKLCIVQFPHPGNETHPKSCVYVKWNLSKTHKRKYLCCTGNYMKNGIEVRDRLMFWGEWEPDSYIIRDYGINNSPRYLQKPIWPCEIPISTKCCGTDPFVFNNEFLYGICKQTKRLSKTKNHSITQLARLQIGSLILFGSTLNQNTPNACFAVDTIFVVSDYVEYDDSSIDYVQGSVREQDYTLIAQLNGVETEKRRCYKGATPKNPYYGMYSFCPCVIYNSEGVGHERLILDKNIIRNINKMLPKDVLNPNLNSSPKYNPTIINEEDDEKKESLTIQNVRTVWNELRRLTFEQGLLEGTRFYL